VEAYDPATDTWTRKADMPTARRNFATCVVGGRIYAIGGWVTSSRYAFTTVEQYDPVMDAWTIEVDLPMPRASLSASALNGRIYAIGGTDKTHPCPALSTVYELTISTPTPDFNGDGMVDIKDLLRLIESWGKDDPLIDIAPPPFGDDVVDALDLELLMGFWEQPVDDPTLIAHWKLDETEGDIAYDSTGVNDAFVIGGAEWQPGGGQIDGALQLNGIDDYVVTDYVLDPAYEPFSIFAWIQGSAPGQVVISQQSMANWLTLDAEGNLMTELKCTGRAAGHLYSETVITDGQWHRIGLVWDGSYRTLCVDGVAVAEDIQPGLESSQMGLYIGVDKNFTPGTFFSGLIDDVRIYNRAITP
jgi:hypothetical protein